MSNSNSPCNKNIKPNSLAHQVQEKYHYTLTTYCKLRGLSIASINRGYISKKARTVLLNDGFNLKIAGVDDNDSK